MLHVCDLHTHTTASDGSYSPSKLVEYAKKKGAKAIAITDHDTIDGLQEALERGVLIHQKVIPGIEITTVAESCEIHIVGLFVDINNEQFCKEVKSLSLSRKERNKKMIDKLSKNGFEINNSDLLEFKDRMITKAHVGAVLVKKGYAPDVTQAMNTFLRKGGVGYVERETLLPEECIALIHKGGGLAFVAHINQIDKTDKQKSLSICRSLLELGADGLETRYCEYDDFWRKETLKLAKELNKLESGGSDFHGEYKKGLDIIQGYGDLEVPFSFVEIMEKELLRRKDLTG